MSEWSKAETDYLRLLHLSRKSPQSVAARLGRTVEEVKAKWEELQAVPEKKDAPPANESIKVVPRVSANSILEIKGTNHVQTSYLQAMAYYNELGECFRRFGMVVGNSLQAHELEEGIRTVDFKSPKELAKFLCENYVVMPIPPQQDGPTKPAE